MSVQQITDSLALEAAEDHGAIIGQGRILRLFDGGHEADLGRYGQPAGGYLDQAASLPEMAIVGSNCRWNLGQAGSFNQLRDLCPREGVLSPKAIESSHVGPYEGCVTDLGSQLSQGPS